MKTFVEQRAEQGGCQSLGLQLYAYAAVPMSEPLPAVIVSVPESGADFGDFKLRTA